MQDCCGCGFAVRHWWGRLLVHYAGSWVPSQVVEVVTRFARRLNKEVAWGDIQQLLVLIHQVQSRFSFLTWVKPNMYQHSHVVHSVKDVSGKLLCMMKRKYM